ncbi:hypothetical protein GCM10022276_06170 [Sphingomonas limnosediminicola]|uniref:Uncharacterized protein n=1 Tax=Sphingomonas limnosediminicola TaxID=940133 RepID=A0ABP7L007_9SPHN
MFLRAYLAPMPRRFTIEGQQLAIVIAGWLRVLPKWAWGEEPGHAKLKKEGRRRSDLDAPDPKRMAADLIAEKLRELGWEVSYEERDNFFCDRTGPPPSRPGNSEG